MLMREIPESEWPAALDEFSRDNEGRPVRIILNGPDGSLNQEADELPLLGLTAEDLPGRGQQIEVTAGDASGVYISRTIDHPTRMAIGYDDDDSCTCIEIEGEDGVKTSVEVQDFDSFGGMSDDDGLYPTA